MRWVVTTINRNWTLSGPAPLTTTRTTVTAASAEIDSTGCLIFKQSDGVLVTAFTTGEWAKVRMEEMDEGE